MRTIDAGHGPNNTGNGLNDPGAVAGGNVERDLNRGLASAVKYRWERNSNEPCVVIDSGPFWTRDNAAAALGSRQHIAIHFDSGGPDASGTSVFVNRGSSASVHKWAHSLGQEVANAQGINFRGVFEKDFGTLGGKMLDALIEVCFVSNRSEIENYIKHHANVADAIVRGMAWGVAPVQRPVYTEPVNEGYDLVLIHADHANARTFVKMAETLGKAKVSRTVGKLSGTTNEARTAQMQQGIQAAVDEMFG